MSNRRPSALPLVGWLFMLQGTSVRAEPASKDAGVSARSARSASDAGAAVRAAPATIAEVLHNTSALSRLRMRCTASSGEHAEEKPLDRLRCAFATVSLRPQPPEKMATLENYGEILRELRTQCRNESPRSEPARLACVACRGELSDSCLYEQAMKNMRKECAKPPVESTHANPAVAALDKAEAARGRGNAQVMQRFCAACAQTPTASCWSAFWASIAPPARCTLAMDGFELELARQGKTPTWTGNLGGPCNTQVTLALDERRKVWTYTELWLSPEHCSQGDAVAQAGKPVVYTSAGQYAFNDLPAMCERITWQ